MEETECQPMPEEQNLAENPAIAADYEHAVHTGVSSHEVSGLLLSLVGLAQGARIMEP